MNVSSNSSRSGSIPISRIYWLLTESRVLNPMNLQVKSCSQLACSRVIHIFINGTAYIYCEVYLFIYLHNFEFHWLKCIYIPFVIKYLYRCLYLNVYMIHNVVGLVDDYVGYLFDKIFYKKIRWSHANYW